jgi:hypothetical protein
MKRFFAVLAVLAVAVPLMAQQRVIDKDGRVIQLFLQKDHPAFAQPARRQQNISYHGGPTITSAKVVSIFWGSQWGSNTNPSTLANAMLTFFNQYGMTGEYNVITQYSGIQLTNLTMTRWVDSANPPTAVSDTAIQNEVIKYLTPASQGGGGGSFDNSTIYEVFLPSTSYASLGSSSSCGGPNVQFCAYHSNFSWNGHDVKYSSMPYPSCGGCQWPGWTVAQNLDHFATHETREAVTDPDGNAWFDRSGNEADDKCAWSPNPFLDGSQPFGYQYEWSNADGGCVKTR